MLSITVSVFSAKCKRNKIFRRNTLIEHCYTIEQTVAFKQILVLNPQQKNFLLGRS